MPAALVAFLLLMAPPAGEFVATGPGDDRPVGLLVRLTPDGTADLATAGGRASVPDLIDLRRADRPAPALSRGPALLTTAGDRIPGAVMSGDDRTLRFRPTAADEEWTVPLTAAAVLWLVRPPADTPLDPADYPWLAGRRKRDVLLLRNADTLSGTLDAVTADPAAVRFKPDAGDARTLPLAEVAAVAFNPALARTPKPKGRFARLALRDGTRVAVADPAATAEAVTGKTLFGQPVTFPLDAIVRLGVAKGKAVDLADLEPAAVEQAGFLGVTWPWAADRSVRGGELRLRTAAGVETFDRGLGTHPRTALTYDLGGKYRRFEAVVGLDPETARQGRAAVRVIVGGKEQPLPELARLGPGEAVPVRVDLRGAKLLKLVVDFGPGGGVGADVNWGDARLIE